MISKAVYDLWYFDWKARRRYQLWTILIAFIYGVFNSLALGRPEDHVTWETLGLVGALTVAFTFYYWLRTVASYEALHAKVHEFLRRRRVFLELGLAATILLLFISLVRYVPNGTVEAFSLNSQLREVTAVGTISRSTLTQVDTVFQKATADRVSLDPRLVTIANDKLLEEARINPGAWPVVLGALSYRSGLDIEAATSFPVNNGCFTPPPVSGATVRIEELTIVGCNGQSLDGLRLKDMAFKDSTIFYHGGSALLQNVEFKNCRFILDYSPGAQELAKALTESKSVTITLPGT